MLTPSLTSPLSLLAQMRCVIKNADGPQRLVFATDDNGDADSSSTYGLTHLSLTIVGKMVAMAVSLGTGFVGGQVPSIVDIFLTPYDTPPTRI